MSPYPTLNLDEFFTEGHRHFLPHLSIDCVIFGFHERKLKVLLLQWKKADWWSLPGGFIFKNEDIDDAAVRILKDRTGLRNIYLHQFRTFGKPHREKGKSQLHKKLWAKKANWMDSRFVTIGYWALAEFSKAIPATDEFSRDCRWWDISKVPDLILDHNDILEKALDSLRLNLNDYPVGKDLLPAKFTMPELQQLYETILGKKLDRRNFQKKMLSIGILQRLRERKQGVPHKAPFLYRFNSKKYHQASRQGIKFGK